MKLIAQWLWFGAASLWCANALSAAAFNIPTPATLSLRATQGGMRITYRGATNFPYSVHTSSNLQSWSVFTNSVALTTNLIFFDPVTNRPARFYKASSFQSPFFYRGTNSGAENGAFILLVRTNNSTVFMGVNLTTGHKRGEYTTALTVDTNGLTCGTYILGAPGCLSLTLSNTITGKFTNASTSATGTVTGTQRANVGPYNGYAGIYSGNVSGHDGPALLLLCPDGSMAIYRTDGNRNDGAVSMMNPQGDIVDAYLNGSVILHVTGTFQRATRTFNLIIHETDGTVSSLSMALSEPFL
jgi:hypothetical protein